MTRIVRFVGIDVAMGKLDVHIAPEGDALTVANTAAGLDRLKARLGAGDVIALEASGGYERLAAEGLAGAGWTIYRLHPADIRAFARLEGRRAKTDWIDARLIARAAGIAAGSTRVPYQARPNAADIKEMVACRRLLNDQLAALKGQRTRLATAAMRAVLDTRIASLRDDITRIDRTIESRIAADATLDETARRIRTAPGAGPVLAATLIANLPELGALASRQAASLTGVAPHPRQSGTSAGRGRCQAGHAAVRRVLYMASLAAIRSRSSPLRAFYERLRAAGKPFKLAIVAVMRKFIVMLNAMIKTRQDWKPASP